MANDSGGQKRCLVIRHGAFGDSIMASAALPYIEDDGYEIDYYTEERGREIMKNNPRVKNFVMHDTDIPVGDDLIAAWDRAGEGYDKVVNFTGAVENELLFAIKQDMYYRPLRERRAYVNGRNYYERHIEIAGYKVNGKGMRPEIYFSKSEKQKGVKFRVKHKKHFVVVWALSGSSMHKVYRHFIECAREFLNRHEDVFLVTVGDYTTKLLTFEHPRVRNTMFFEIPFRETMLLTKYADVVVGPETGAMVAASAFDTPKIWLCSHASPDQLTTKSGNEHFIQAPCYCSPCHLLHKYTYIWREVCQVGTPMRLPDGRLHTMPACCEHGKGDILDKLEEVYNERRN